MFVTCPRCFTTDDVSYRRLPDKMVQYSCAGAHEGSGEHHWIATQSSAMWTADANDGVTDELLDPLLRCVVAGEPFVEFGVVEYRLRTDYPDLFAVHVRERGHVMIAPGQATASSVRFAATLGRLARRGDLLSIYGPATGAWSYNGQVTYWAKPPTTAAPHLTWSEFCVRIGRSDMWTDEDRAAVPHVC